MIRSLVLLAGIFGANAASTSECALNGARAVDDLLDSATYIWASVQRCQKPGTGNGQGNAILCSLDISSAIEATNAMVNVILKAVEKCGNLEGENTKCGLQVGVLTKAFAGLAASTSGVIAKCPGPLNANNLTFLVQDPLITAGNSALASAAQQASFAQCLVDVKDTTKSLFKVTKRIIDVKENCDGEHARHCAHNGLKITASFAAMGEYLAGALGRCSANTVANKNLRDGGQCAQEALSLVRHTDNTARASMYLNKYCFEESERLYQIEDGVQMDNTSSGSSMTLALTALLPLTAVVAFVGGSRLAKRSNREFGALALDEEGETTI